jgi:hypothetical protein
VLEQHQEPRENQHETRGNSAAESSVLKNTIVTISIHQKLQLLLQLDSPEFPAKFQIHQR